MALTRGDAAGAVAARDETGLVFLQRPSMWDPTTAEPAASVTHRATGLGLEESRMDNSVPSATLFASQRAEGERRKRYIAATGRYQTGTGAFSARQPIPVSQLLPAADSVTVSKDAALLREQLALLSAEAEWREMRDVLAPSDATAMRDAVDRVLTRGPGQGFRPELNPAVVYLFEREHRGDTWVDGWVPMSVFASVWELFLRAPRVQMTSIIERRRALLWKAAFGGGRGGTSEPSVVPPPLQPGVDYTLSILAGEKAETVRAMQHALTREAARRGAEADARAQVAIEDRGGQDDSDKKKNKGKKGRGKGAGKGQGPGRP